MQYDTIAVNTICVQNFIFSAPFCLQNQLRKQPKECIIIAAVDLMKRNADKSAEAELTQGQSR